jgi:multisubunit Na+/H+ antiporter MnhE subunit
MSATSQDARRHRRGRWTRRSVFVLIWTILMLGWWMMLVDSPAYVEALAGLVAAAIAALLLLCVLLLSGIRFRPRLRWILWLRHIPWGILHDTVILLTVLWRRLARKERPQSVFYLVRFPTGGDDPESAARRAFATAATALAPNTYLIGFDRERGVTLVHQLVPSDPERMRRAIVGAESA